jgi:hypothetical protein
MSREHEARKENRKKAGKTLKERRLEKRMKKTTGLQPGIHVE